MKKEQKTEGRYNVLQYEASLPAGIYNVHVS